MAEKLIYQTNTTKLQHKENIIVSCSNAAIGFYEPKTYPSLVGKRSLTTTAQFCSLIVTEFWKINHLGAFDT